MRKSIFLGFIIVLLILMVGCAQNPPIPEHLTKDNIEKLKSEAKAAEAKLEELNKEKAELEQIYKEKKAKTDERREYVEKLKSELGN